MSNSALLTDSPGQNLFMLGNEAIARGAIEAGVQVYAAYPGTPSSEISDTLIGLSKEAGFYAEWSVNEKVAFETAFGAAVCGVRAMTSMKHVGLNVAHDPLMSATYIGVVGGMVLVNADDPGLWSSQNEQDNRFIAEQAYLPILEPSSPQEAREMTVEAFNLSEKFGHIFMLRSVTRISHARGDVTLGPISPQRRPGHFTKREANIVVPAFARKSRKALLERFAEIKDLVDNLSFNRLQLVPGAKLGIIASGISYSYTLEALRWLGLEDRVSLLKIGTPHPLPDKMVKQLLESVPEALVIEELEPFVENHVKVIAQEAGLNLKIQGKNVVPIRGELSTRSVMEAIAAVAGVKMPVDFSVQDRLISQAETVLPQRPPTLCAGCPHRASFYAVNAAVNKVKKDLGDRVLSGDIGCYSLGINPPLSSYDINCCMGGGFGVGSGLSRGQTGPVVAHLGDSTFFHSGIPAMINAVFNHTKLTMLVLDNSATAMTGFQPHPGSPGANQSGIRPEDIARACNVPFVEVVDCFDVKKTVEVLEQALRSEGPAVIVSRGMCQILNQREQKKRGQPVKAYQVNVETCTGCHLCVNTLGCPAMLLEGPKVAIDATQCVGCAVCSQVCPTGAIIQI